VLVNGASKQKAQMPVSGYAADRNIKPFTADSLTRVALDVMIMLIVNYWK
jgi:hypothetical protein